MMRGRRLIRTTLLVLVGLYLVYLMLLAAMQRALLYHPDAQPPPAGPPQSLLAQGLEQHWLDTPQGRVEIWFLPGDGVTERHPGPAVFFAHGNAELIDNWPPMLAPYQRLGVSVILVEYRGYGRSDGKPTQTRITEDFVAAFDLITQRPDVDPTRLIYHGRSLGGGVVMTLTTHHPPAAIILESTFTSMADMAQHFGVPRFLARHLLSDPYDSLTTLSRFNGPVLIFHGERDTIVPYAHGQRLHDNARNSRLVTMSCGHNDMPNDPTAYWQAIEHHMHDANVLRR